MSAPLGYNAVPGGEHRSNRGSYAERASLSPGIVVAEAAIPPPQSRPPPARRGSAGPARGKRDGDRGDDRRRHLQRPRRHHRPCRAPRLRRLPARRHHRRPHRPRLRPPGAARRPRGRPLHLPARGGPFQRGRLGRLAPDRRLRLRPGRLRLHLRPLPGQRPRRSGPRRAAERRRHHGDLRGDQPARGDRLGADRGRDRLHQAGRAGRGLGDRDRDVLAEPPRPDRQQGAARRLPRRRGDLRRLRGFRAGALRLRRHRRAASHRAPGSLSVGCRGGLRLRRGHDRLSDAAARPGDRRPKGGRLRRGRGEGPRHLRPLGGDPGCGLLDQLGDQRDAVLDRPAGPRRQCRARASGPPGPRTRRSAGRRGGLAGATRSRVLAAARHHRDRLLRLADLPAGLRPDQPAARAPYRPSRLGQTSCLPRRSCLLRGGRRSPLLPCSLRSRGPGADRRLRRRSWSWRGPCSFAGLRLDRRLPPPGARARSGPRWRPRRRPWRSA